MSENTSNQENAADSSQSDSRINNVVALTQLVGTIVDYYSFKNKLIEDEDEVDKWKKGNADESPIVPKNIDDIIEKSFIAQLNKFTE
jgi:hypothetical protein